MNSFMRVFTSLTLTGWAVFVLGVAAMTYALIFLRTTPCKFDNWECQEIGITDSAGKKAKIQLVILSRDFSWVLNSSEEVERNGKRMNMEEFREHHLQTPGILEALRSYSEIIAVGAASSEGSISNPSMENNRARIRADELQLKIKEAIGSTSLVHTLSLGYCLDSPNNTNTSRQRTIVLIGVLKKDKDFDLESGLRNELKTNETFPFNPSRYSDFLLTRER